MIMFESPRHVSEINITAKSPARIQKKNSNKSFYFKASIGCNTYELKVKNKLMRHASQLRGLSGGCWVLDIPLPII